MRPRGRVHRAVGVHQRDLERRCPSGSATRAGWARTRSSPSSRTGRRCSPGWPHSTMSRDDSWRFYLLGRSVERVDMIVRLLLSRVADRMSTSPAGSPCCAAPVLRDTYLRTYRGALDASRVVQFLLMDKLFPRSVFHALRQAEILPGRRSTTGPVCPDRGQGRGAAAARAGPVGAGVPAPGGAARRPRRPSCWPAGLHPRRRRGRVPAVLPRRALGGVERRRR